MKVWLKNSASLLLYIIRDFKTYKSILLELPKTQNELILTVSSGSRWIHTLAYERIKRPSSDRII